MTDANRVAVTHDEQRSSELSVSWAAGSIPGKSRTVNEDAWDVADGVFVIADGMGGYAAGDLASSLTVSHWTATLADHERGLPSLSSIEALVTSTNELVRSEGAKRGVSALGTTLVALALAENGGEGSLVVTHVGDSRCYALSERLGLRQLTVDHSVVQELIEAGTMSRHEVAGHPERHVVTRALGTEPGVAADFFVIEPGRERLLLCTDGVHGQLGDAQIEHELRSGGEPAAVVRALLDAVLAGPAADNATALVVDVEPFDADTLDRSSWEEITEPRGPRASGVDEDAERGERP